MKSVKILFCLAAALLTFGCSTKLVVPAIPAHAQASPVIWHELITPKNPKLHRFYKELFSWTFVANESGYYQILDDNGLLIGGQMPGELLSKSLTSGLWLMSVKVENMEESLALAEKSGGSIIHPATLLENRGLVALVADPEGALLEMVEAKSWGAPPKSKAPWIWHELVSSNPDAAADWYAGMFGLEKEALSDERIILKKKGEAIATVSKNPFEETSSIWIPVLQVENLHQVLDDVTSLGGTVAVPPKESLAGGLLALILDPTGAAFVLQQIEVSP